MKDALRTFAKSGLFAAEFDSALGGMQLPATVARAGMAWFQAASASTSSYALLTIAGAKKWPLVSSALTTGPPATHRTSERWDHVRDSILRARSDTDGDVLDAAGRAAVFALFDGQDGGA